ncbi:hypothetical protein SERLA73DRAFT_131539 [Serpula lacrymans var. lacrymans S7.3]|uniref:50S ribosomal protein L36 n=2 Tax=Serpula lacrymans var. lacrymans TaxID=341189 RepID=F8PN72_SERL3|nr:uncharacterized protein SERLADRAFT_380914 [Serpula lacrymans var. lacrymans S7.9]EGO03054.1 hypothetical protein SERLA73DRAFT_131539 [Serpula lacrymans var. lacrymans S7.3]EGO28794.1 hypothetical protein SERLADRAFT_380914 [Serpula lacrymans var. lacrymans S7.9]
MSFVSIPKIGAKISFTSLTPCIFSRSVSSSPYGRTHVYTRRPNKLPNPLVPHFPQRVYRADGSSFTHWTTSPRSRIRLTRDTTNNPLYHATARLAAQGLGGIEEEEEEGTGRMGRFRRRFGREVNVGDWAELHDEASTGQTLETMSASDNAKRKPAKK